MTTALERVRAAISEGTSLRKDDVAELLCQMPDELQYGLGRLISGVVATFHSNGGPGVEDWMEETVERYLDHAQDHARFAYGIATKDDTVDCRIPNTEDGLRHVDHAACRMAMAFARERIVNGKR